MGKEALYINSNQFLTDVAIYEIEVDGTMKLLKLDSYSNMIDNIEDLVRNSNMSTFIINKEDVALKSCLSKIEGIEVIQI